AFNNRGAILTIKGDIDGALADLDQAIKLNPGRGHFYINRGKAWLLKGDAARAISDLDQAIELDASDAQAWLTRGVIRAEERDYTRSLADFDQAVKLAPRLADAWQNRAVMLLWMERLPEAEAAFARFSELGGRIKPEAEQLWREVKERLKQKQAVSQGLKSR